MKHNNKPSSNPNSLYLGSVPPEIRREDIESHFANLGISITINHQQSSPEKKFYVIEVQSEDHFNFILDNSDLHRIKGYDIVMAKNLLGQDMRALDEREKSKKLYVGNLPKNTKDSDLKNFFEEKFGKVVSAYVKNRNNTEKISILALSLFMMRKLLNS